MSGDRRRGATAPEHGVDVPAGDSVTEDSAPAPVRGARARRRAAREAAREAEQARTVRRLRRFGVPAGIAALVLVLLVGFLIARGGGSGGDGGSGAERTQQTVMIQVVPSAGRAATGTALTAADPDQGSGVFAALPGRLITDVPGRGRTTLDQTTVTEQADAAAQAIGDQLDVVVDGSWVLTSAAFAQLVDKVGGVTVDVDVDVTVGGVVVIPAGSARTLEGADAVRYATYLAPGEAEQARLARFTAVWTEILRKLPDDQGAVASLIGGLTGSSSTLPADELAGYLVTLHRAVVSDSTAYPTLPTAVVETGAGATSYRVDGAKAPDFVRQYFGDSIPPTPPGGAITVLVQNGVGTPGLAAKARTKLLAADLTYQGGGNASRFGYRTSVVLIPDATAESRANGAAVAAALGLPASAVKISPQGQSVADVLVILGSDFRG